MENLSYNDIVELALAHGFEGNPRGTKKLALIEFITNNPIKEVEELALENKEETKEETKEDPVQEPVVVAVEAPKEPVKTKKNLVVDTRRQSIAQLVEAKLQEVTKPLEHTQVFYEVFGKDFPKGNDANEKWRDIGHVLLALVNSGKVLAHTPDGKKRDVFSWKREEVVEEKKEDPAPESTNTEGEGI